MKRWTSPSYRPHGMNLLAEWSLNRIRQVRLSMLRRLEACPKFCWMRTPSPLPLIVPMRSVTQSFITTHYLEAGKNDLMLQCYEHSLSFNEDYLLARHAIIYEKLIEVKAKMYMTSLNVKSPSIVQTRSEAPSFVIMMLIHFLLLYLSIYGLISIYVDNIVIRSLKDAGMLLLAVYTLVRVYRQQIHFLNLFLFLLGSIILLGSLNVLIGSSVVTLVYGIKITLLPLVMLFAGMFMAEQGGMYAFARTNLVIFIMLIAGWCAQYALGIEKLITMGFIYGVNIKTTLRVSRVYLPSRIPRMGMRMRC